MFRLNLPQYEIKIGEKNGKRTIFDFLRRKYVTLTPEEWVRQHFTHYLTDHKGYPKGLMGNEVELRVGEKRLRCDTILYNKQGQPQMIIEYKALRYKYNRRLSTRYRSTIFCCMWIISS